MISLEQVKLLEAKVVRAIEYVERISAENAGLHKKEAELQAKIDSCQKRIDELEALVLSFKENQTGIEDGILAALDRLNQFEEAIEKSFDEKQAGNKTAKPARAGEGLLAKGGLTPGKPQEQPEQIEPQLPSSGEMFFEIPEEETDEDITGHFAEDGDEDEYNEEDNKKKDPDSTDGELGIF